MAKQSQRNWFLVTYLPEDTLLGILNNPASGIMHYAYATHSKDNPVHTHVAVRFNNERSFNGVKELFQRAGKSLDNGKDVNTLCEPCIDIQGAFNYLTHKDCPDKTQYPEDIIVSDDIGYFRGDYSRAKADSENDTNKAFLILSDLMDGVDWLTLAKRYGREIIINRFAYMEYADLIRKQQARQQTPRAILVDEETGEVEKILEKKSKK